MMLKNVQIIEKSSGHIIAKYPIDIEIADTLEEDLFADAWENAIDEGMVKEGNRDNYDIEIVGDISTE